MKLLIVFISALVLVAQGKVVSTGDGDRVLAVELQPEEVGSYAAEEAVQEAGGVGPQRLFAQEGDGDSAVRVFNAEEQPQVVQLDANEVPQFSMPQSVKIPTLTRPCTDSACAYICSLLGFKNGVCVSTSTCECSN